MRVREHLVELVLTYLSTGSGNQRRLPKFISQLSQLISAELAHVSIFKFHPDKSGQATLTVSVL